MSDYVFHKYAVLIGDYIVRFAESDTQDLTYDERILPVVPAAPPADLGATEPFSIEYEVLQDNVRAYYRLWR